MAKQPNDPYGNLKSYQETVKAQEEIRKLEEKRLKINEEIKNSLGFQSAFVKDISNNERELELRKQRISQLEERIKAALKEGDRSNSNRIKGLKNGIIQHQKQIRLIEQENKAIKAQAELYQKIGNSIKSFASANFGLGAVTTYLMESDKAIKQLNLQLGLSGGKADEMRANIQGAATYAQRLGVSVGDLAKAQAEFSDETQRTVALTEKEFKQITNIGKGTALGVESAGKLVAQFDLLGVSVQQSEKFVQGVVDTSERMGINATKVLKNISTNFKTLNTFSFKDGIKGMAKMSEYAEKFKVDINDSINSAKLARSLEGAIEMASQLNVLGGEFAKTDPFELLFLSRNDPAKYTKKLAELTKGMATLKKTEEGFTLGINPQDQDRLKQAADALGVSYENLAESALRVKKVQLTRQEMLGLNLTSEQKEYIEGISKFNENTGKMFVTINGLDKNIANLTSNDIKMLKQQDKTLEARAKDSQTFDEMLKNTMLEMKSALLPILKMINGVLTSVNEFKDKFPNLTKGLGIAAGTLLAAFTAGKAIFAARTIAKGGIKGLFGLGSLGGGATADAAGGGAGGGGGGLISKLGGAGGKAMAANLAAVGAAAAGVGIGIGAAALGISKLATAMKELDGTQIWGLAGVVTAIGIAMSVVLVPAILALGSAGTVGAVGLLAIGGAALGIGAGIGIAAAGIGFMADGIGKMIEKASNANNLFTVAAGIAAIGTAMASLGVGGILGVIGGGGALGMILAIASQADDLVKVGDAFKNISVVLNANAGQIERVEKAIANIASTKIDSNSMFAEIANLLSKPLKVEFADKSIAVKTDVTLEINRERLAKVLDIGREATIQSVRQQQGTSSANRI